MQNPKLRYFKPFEFFDHTGSVAASSHAFFSHDLSVNPKTPMQTNTQAVLSAYIASIGKRSPRDAAQEAAELCRFASSLNRLNEIACNSGLSERQERRKQNLQTRIKAVLQRAGLVLNHFNSDPRGYAVYLDLPDGSYNSFGGRECGYGIGR